ncbi:MAG TPA: DUF6036 family nucleotidyltransferase [Longimicrobiaceae bacterium]|nr:DUF6036 family nucleotidyltransferase [Longimicrobiaceae bacterium]
MTEPVLPIEEALRAVGDILRASGERVSIVVVGGATMNLLGIVRRSTRDIDVIARAWRDAQGDLHLTHAEPFPESLRRAIRTVARDLGLPENWMNAEVGSQWVHGLPPWILDEITWRAYASLDVGLVGRRTLIALKLFASVDSGPGSVHVQDLLALAPTDAELEESASWVSTQDAYDGFSSMISQVAEHVRRNRP